MLIVQAVIMEDGEVSAIVSDRERDISKEAWETEMEEMGYSLFLKNVVDAWNYWECTLTNPENGQSLTVTRRVKEVPHVSVS